MIFKKDNLRLGLILGLVAPILSLVIYYFVKFYPLYTVTDFLNFIRMSRSQITAVSIPCLVLNIVLFTIYINSRRDATAKGIFAATVIYAILGLFLKFML